MESNIHSFFRYSVSGYFFIALIVAFSIIFSQTTDIFTQNRVILWILNNSFIGVMTGFFGSFLLGFIFHQIHSVVYELKIWKGLLKINRHNMKYIEFIRKKKKFQEDFIKIRAFNDCA